MCFTSDSRGKILDDFPDIKLRDRVTLDQIRRQESPLLGGLEIPDAVRSSLKWMAFVASECFVFEYDESKGPEIEDLLRARDGCWDHIIPLEDTIKIRHGVVEEFVKKGQRIAYSALPHVYTRSQWDFIDRMTVEASKGTEASFSPEEALVLQGLADREF
jgi:hypothetical protein